MTYKERQEEEEEARLFNEYSDHICGPLEKPECKAIIDVYEDGFVHKIGNDIIDYNCRFILWADKKDQPSCYQLTVEELNKYTGAVIREFKSPIVEETMGESDALLLRAGKYEFFLDGTRELTTAGVSRWIGDEPTKEQTSEDFYPR